MRTKSQSGRDLKDNSGKHPQKHDDWMEAKKVGRPKQAWVESTLGGNLVFEPEDITEENLHTYISAHWEKLDTTT